MTEKSPLFNMVGTAFITFFKVLPALLIFEVAYKLLCAAVFRPVLALVMQQALNISGYEMAFNGDIAGFYTNAAGIIGTVILCIFAALLAYFEYAVLILMIYYRYTGNRFSLADSMKMALTTFKSLKSFGFIGFILYALGLLPLINFGFAPSIRPEGEIPNFITGELYKSTLGSLGIAVFYGLMYLIFFCLIFVLPAMVLRRRKFGRSIRVSLSLLLSIKLRNTIPLLLLLALWYVLFLHPGFVPTYYAGISDADLAQILGNFFFSWKSILHFFLGEGLQIILAILLFTYLIALYLLTSGKVSLNEKAMPTIDRRLKTTQNIVYKVYSFFRKIGESVSFWIRSRPFYQNHKRPVWAIICILLFLGIFGLLYNQPNAYDQVVAGHRGSQEGVENTIQAIQGAVDAKADYAEVDILLSKDGVPVVVHDDNLKRLSGQNLNVYELTAGQLSKISLSQNDLQGTISTLAEIIEYCRGKIDLLIELKLHGHEKSSIVEAVTRVIEQKHFQRNCKIMSLEYDLVKELKTGYPEYTVGYCVYGNLGIARLNSLRKLNVDFLIIEESVASKSFISQCNRAWLPAYVWTVNEKQSMESCLKMGAAGIITDKPKEARGVVDQFIKDSM